MHNETVIQVEGLEKRYRLGQINHGALYRDIQSQWARFRGRPDPNARIAKDSLFQKEEDRVRDGDFLALDDVSFEVQRGEVVGIVGRNGAGKSTLLKLLSRITMPSKGAIRLKGHVASLLEVGTGFHPELTGRENIFLNGAILGMSNREIRRNLDEIIDFAEVEQFIDTPVKRYSSGMHVRLAFAVAAHLNPEILVVDEVLAVGDLAFQRKCLGRMQIASRSGRTVLFVSHNLTAVSHLCSRSLLLSGGKLIKDGPTPEVLNHYVSMTETDRLSRRHYPRPAGEFVAKVREVAVVARGVSDQTTSNVELTEGFSIQIDYEIGAPAAGISVGLQIIAVEGAQTIISLSDPELELSRLDVRSPGYYSSRVEIPGRLLNTGLYQVRVGVSTRSQIYDVIEDVSFEVQDSVGITQALGYERKGSLLALQLPWAVARH